MKRPTEAGHCGEVDVSLVVQAAAQVVHTRLGSSSDGRFRELVADVARVLGRHLTRCSIERIADAEDQARWHRDQERGKGAA